MLAVISPAKSLDFDSPPATGKHSQPDFLSDSRALIGELRNRSAADLSDLMHISSKLAELNYQRYSDWQTPFSPDNAKAAMLAFTGDVYMGLQANDLSERDFTWAQNHLRILSGLHGLLKPLDLIQPYRLEMGTKLGNPRGDDLYAFWRAKVTRALDRAITQAHGSKGGRPVLLNLASNEYFNVLDTSRLNARIITPTFKDLRKGRYTFISFFAKKARGAMARFMIENRVTTVKGLKEFAQDDYYFEASLSNDDDWVFHRDRQG